jgi:hypothetical protein
MHKKSLPLSKWGMSLHHNLKHTKQPEQCHLLNNKSLQPEIKVKTSKLLLSAPKQT